MSNIGKNKNFESRLLTFKDKKLLLLDHTLAKLGFYYHEESIKCSGCPYICQNKNDFDSFSKILKDHLKYLQEKRKKNKSCDFKDDHIKFISDEEEKNKNFRERLATFNNKNLE